MDCYGDGGSRSKPIRQALEEAKRLGRNVLSQVDGRTVSVPLLNEKQLVARSTAEAAGKRCDPYRDTETDRVPQKEQKNSRRGLPVSGGQRRRMG